MRVRASAAVWGAGGRASTFSFRAQSLDAVSPMRGQFAVGTIRDRLDSIDMNTGFDAGGLHMDPGYSAASLTREQGHDVGARFPSRLQMASPDIQDAKTSENGQNISDGSTDSETDSETASETGSETGNSDDAPDKEVTESEDNDVDQGIKLRPRPICRDIVAVKTSQEPRKRKAPKLPEPRRKASSEVARERAQIVQALEDAKLKVAAYEKQLKEFDETHQ